MTNEEMIANLKRVLKPSRFLHTMNVVETSLILADIYGCDRDKAYLAALLHDCAKSMNREEMLSVCEDAEVSVDEYELNAEPVLHAPAGCALSKTVYGIKDPDILNAIRYHTIGCESPSLLTKIIYVADFAEPGRKPFKGLEEVRRIMTTDLDRALIMAAKLSSDYVLQCGGCVHPLTHQMILNTEVHP